MKRITLIAVLLTFGIGMLQAEEPCTKKVIRVWIPAELQPEIVTSWTDVWESDKKNRTLLIDVDEDGLDRLRALGLRWEIDREKTAEYCAPHFLLPHQRAGIPGYPCYRTVEETYQTAEEIVAAHPDLAQLIDIGDSWEKSQVGGNPGYDMRVLKLTNSQMAGTPTGPGQGKPVMFVTSAIHAREYTTAELMTRFAEYLIENYGTDADATWLLDEHEIHLLLHTNPDGRKQAETGKSWRKNTNENYCGATSDSRGADLNRNFSFQWGCCNGSSTDPCDETFRGASAASEPEAQAVESYAASIFPDQREDDPNDPAPDTATGIYMDIHSYSELVLWPWGWDVGDDPPNAVAMQTLGRKLAYFNGYSPDHNIWYAVDGDTIDSLYGKLGVASYVFELGTDFFQDCATFENTILPDNMQALIYAAKVARTPYLTPSGPEILDLEIDGGDFADDARFNNSQGTEPTGTINEARCSFDNPPWSDPAPSFMALSALDGTFDSSAEDLHGSLPTTGLSDGRHTLFCEAKDEAGQWGPVSAVFFWVMDPSAAPHIAGKVLSAVDGSPIEALVSAGTVVSVRSDPATGAYDLMLPQGIWDVTARPDGNTFSTSTIEDVHAQNGVTRSLDFRLQPFALFFSDDGEQGIPAGWTADSPWTLSEEDAASPTHAWTDSPGGNYGDNLSVSLTSGDLDLSGYSAARLEFSQHYQTEATYDFCHVEISSDGGNTWTEIATYDGDSGGWEAIILDISSVFPVTQVKKMMAGTWMTS